MRNTQLVKRCLPWPCFHWQSAREVCLWRRRCPAESEPRGSHLGTLCIPEWGGWRRPGRAGAADGAWGLKMSIFYVVNIFWSFSSESLYLSHHQAGPCPRHPVARVFMRVYWSFCLIKAHLVTSVKCYDWTLEPIIWCQSEASSVRGWPIRTLDSVIVYSFLNSGHTRRHYQALIPFVKFKSQSLIFTIYRLDHFIFYAQADGF